MVVATSTNVAQPNFRYVVRVTNTTTSEVLPDVIVPPNPQNRLMFDLSKVIESNVLLKVYNETTLDNYISNLNMVTSTDWLNCIMQLSVKIYEAYDVAGGVTINLVS